MFKNLLKSIALLLLFSSSITSIAQNLAFPTAEGYGKYTVGGRGGKVYEVTNLNDSGTGSLRAAVEASGARIVVFRVSGTIYLKSSLNIKNPNITIAGQTAPGDGICIASWPLEVSANQVVIRYIRVRLGDLAGNVNDASGSRFTSNIILDHVSASWSIDETFSFYHCDNITIQWCMISESLYDSNHPNNADPSQTAPHGFGGIWGSNYGSYHHNLIADHSSRAIRMASGSGNTDYRNNVIYNWGGNNCYGGEKQQVGDTDPAHSFSKINVVNNYYKPGPATLGGGITYRIINPNYRTDKSDYGQWYVSGNYMNGNSAVTSDNWNGGVQPQGGSGDYSLLKMSSAWSAMPITQQSATGCYSLVLDNAGAILPKRDAVDARVVSDVKSGSATYEGPGYKKYNTLVDSSKKSGIIDSQNNVGGYPTLKSTTAPTDSDHDGMPDAWETAHGLKPNDATDGVKTTVASPYTNVEAYLNDLAGELGGTTTPPTTTTPSALIKLGFNENTGSSVSNSGTVSASFSKSSTPTWSTNVPKNGGASSLDFGTTAGNNYVESSSVISQLGGLSNFTITGWVNCKNSTVGSGGNRIVSWINNGGDGVDVVYLADGSLKVGIDQWPDASPAVSSTGKITTNSSAAATNWKFFAITYQSSNGSLKMYFGDNATSATLDKTYTYNQGATGTSIGKLAIGHFNTESSRSTRTDRMFKGLIDQVGIYGSSLSLADIQNIQNLNGANTARKAAPIATESTDAVFNFYPNPVNSVLTIELGQELNTTDAVIELFDYKGKLVSSQKAQTNELQALNMENLASGLYVVKVSNSSTSITKKVLKK